MPTLAELADMTPKESVPARDRTEARDAAFEYIEELRQDGAIEWPLNMSAIAERSQRDVDEGWSRQHIANVIDLYYELPGGRPIGDLRGGQIHIPDDVDDPAAFLRGVAYGLELARDE
jgi:hypothetical protein